MLKEFCNEQFVSKGMIADFAIHDKGDGNPHAHILLTLRAMDEHGRWLPKARKVYDLDENGKRIQLPSGNWKCHKENTVDWNDQKYAEVWRHGWETITNRYLEAAGRPERVDLRSFERQGVQQIPTVHLGPAAHQMEKRGIETFLGNLNRDIRAANSLMQSIRSTIRGLQRWIADLTEKKQLLLDALEKAKEPTPSDLLVDYFNLRNEQRSGWSGKAKLKRTVRDFEEIRQAVDYLKAHSLNTIEDLNAAIKDLSQTVAPLRRQLKQNESQMRAIAQIKDAAAIHPKELIKFNGFFTKLSNGEYLLLNEEGYQVEGQKGTWTVTDEKTIDEQRFVLMVNDQKPDLLPSIVVQSDGKFITSTASGFDNATVRKVRELLHHEKFLENGTAERARESGTEQNYNMIDGCVNTVPKKPRVIGGRVSVLDRLHIKQAERARKDNAQVQQQERTRKN